MSIAEIISEKELQIKDKENTIAELYADHSIIPHVQQQLSPHDPRCPKECGHFDGGNRSCRNRCDQNYYQGHARARELRQQAINRHITPLTRQITHLNNDIVILKEKQKIPLLREQLITATDEFQTLSSNDPEFRQKQIDQKTNLYERAVALDSLERKHNMFGNLPTIRTQPEIIEITPEPITITKEPEIIHKPLTIGSLDFDYTKLAIGGAAIVGILGLIIWRFK